MSKLFTGRLNGCLECEEGLSFTEQVYPEYGDVAIHDDLLVTLPENNDRFYIFTLKSEA